MSQKKPDRCSPPGMTKSRDRPARSKLRTKTGCLTCRQRRKKCDEWRPVCHGCSSSSHECLWPAAPDLVDRRFLSHHQSRHQRNVPMATDDDSHSRRAKDSHIPLGESFGRQRMHCFSPASTTESAITHSALSRDLEHVICHHFVNRFYGLILLPKCHFEYHTGWLAGIFSCMETHKFLYYSVLACAASHLFWIDSSSGMYDLALTYYSGAISGLSKYLTTVSSLERQDGVLMSVMLLNIHGVMGCGTYTDIPRHTEAAAEIVTSRLLRRPSAMQLFDVLALESVLYHIFHAATGLWSDSAKSDHNFDLDIWIQAETLLSQQTFFSLPSRTDNSPVLGVPVPLLRLAIILRRQFRNPAPYCKQVLVDAKQEILNWQNALSNDLLQEFAFISAHSNTNESYNADATSLYTVIISLLQDQLPRAEPGTPHEVPRNNSQMRKALRILKKYDHDDEWARCYIGNWPVYTLGFFMSSSEDRQVIRNDLQRRWDLTRLAQAARFSADLESNWTIQDCG